jgi:hypothetical protein
MRAKRESQHPADAIGEQHGVAVTYLRKLAAEFELDRAQSETAYVCKNTAGNVGPQRRWG